MGYMSFDLRAQADKPSKCGESLCIDVLLSVFVTSAFMVYPNV